VGRLVLDLNWSEVKGIGELESRRSGFGKRAVEVGRAKVEGGIGDCGLILFV
jgi:hypothetical protein